MCMQCMTDAVLVIDEILPGYQLMRSLKNHPDWPKDYLGLVRGGGDPDFVWPYRPVIDTMPDDDDEADKLAHDSPEVLGWREFVVYLAEEKIEERFQCYPLEGFDFVSACTQAGYSREDDGSNVVYWFINKVNKRMVTLCS